MRVRLAGLGMIAALSLAASVSILNAQSGQKPTGAAPWPWSPARLADGQPNIQGLYIPPDWGQPFERVATPTAPRAAGGRSLSDGDAFSDIPRSKNTNPIVVEPADGRVPFLPWAQAVRQHLRKAQDQGNKNRELLDPRSRCLAIGLPWAHWSYPYNSVQILQRPGYVVFLHEPNHQYRMVPLDNRPHPSPKIRLWMGDARGRWEGDTLIVDVTNFNERTWLWGDGIFHSDALHLVERFTPKADGLIQYEATIEDSNVFSQPWKIRFTPYKKVPPDQELFEAACHEGDRRIDTVESGTTVR